MHTCKNCKFEFDGNYCPQCGTKWQDTDNSQSPSKNQTCFQQPAKASSPKTAEPVISKDRSKPIAKTFFASIVTSLFEMLPCIGLAIALSVFGTDEYKNIDFIEKQLNIIISISCVVSLILSAIISFIVPICNRYWKKRTERRAAPVKYRKVASITIFHFIISILCILLLAFGNDKIIELSNFISEENSKITYAILISALSGISVFEIIYSINFLIHFSSDKCKKCKNVFALFNMI